MKARCKLVACGLLLAWFECSSVGLAQEGPVVTTFTVNFPRDEALTRALGMREISGSFTLAQPMPTVELRLEIFEDGKQVEPVRKMTLSRHEGTAGRFALLLVDLEELPTVRNRVEVPLQLAPPRSIHRALVVVGNRVSSSYGPIDTARLPDLHKGVAYHTFAAEAITPTTAPLFALYQGPRGIEREGVVTPEELRQRNPEGKLVIVSVHCPGR